MFCSIVRAPAAIPRRLVGTVPIIAAVFGLLNMPEPTPTTNSHSADQKYARVDAEQSSSPPGRRRRRPSRPPTASASPRLSAQMPANGDEISIPIAIGASSIPAVIGSWPLTPWK